MNVTQGDFFNISIVRRSSNSELHAGKKVAHTMEENRECLTLISRTQEPSQARRLQQIVNWLLYFSDRRLKSKVGGLELFSF